MESIANVQSLLSQLITLGTTYGLQVIGAIVILIVGRIAAGIGRNLVKTLLSKAKQEAAIVSFVGNLSYIAILAFAILAALAKFGIQTASFIAVLGAAGFAIGFALQGSLANFAAGVAGTVREIELFTTVLATPDNVKIMVPNGKIFGDIIKNVSAYDTRRIDLVVGIGYVSSIQKAIEVVMDLIKADKRILSDPVAQIAVSELADSSVNLVVRPWVKAEDYWTVRFDLTRKIKEAFDANDIEIPFPQRVVHMAASDSQ
jgi:small conductance mechanosensitive channel